MKDYLTAGTTLTLDNLQLDFFETRQPQSSSHPGIR
jgi:hypothetical protein